MPECTDERNLLSLATLSSFNLDWLNGVRPGSLSEKAMPDYDLQSTKQLNLTSPSQGLDTRTGTI